MATTATDSEKKVKLQQILTDGLLLQKQVKVVFAGGHNNENTIKQITTLLGQLREKSKQANELCEQLSHDHGKSLVSILNCFIDWNQLVLNATTTNTPTSSEKLKEDSLPIESKLLEIREIAQSFKDASLDARSMELLTNIYNKTNQIDKEVDILEKAVAAEKNPQRAVALFDAYLKKLDHTYQDRDRIYQLNNKEQQQDNEDIKVSTSSSKKQQQKEEKEKEDKDNGFMKLHADAWEIYLWLKSMPGFPRNQFILQRKNALFKLAIYIGSLANPLISAKDKEVVSIAMEAFDEALHIADITQNKEYFCAATAHKSSVVYRTLPEDERVKLFKSLVDVEESMKPVNSEIRDLIQSIENKDPSLFPEKKEQEDKEKEEKLKKENESKN
ncbi:hypothetical protein RB653_009616 [Dictyostelium firmibasis]|uniref:Uncharacterized protein n=1 Tax=Dictyostelium firmibasis TaxID=79012 RepID=A0AAN7U1G5_9MYCE